MFPQLTCCCQRERVPEAERQSSAAAATAATSRPGKAIPVAAVRCSALFGPEFAQLHGCLYVAHLNSINPTCLDRHVYQDLIEDYSLMRRIVLRSDALALQVGWRPEIRIEILRNLFDAASESVMFHYNLCLRCWHSNLNVAEHFCLHSGLV